MDKGRKICDVLKAVRKKIADMNGIIYEPKVCHYKGHCSGTCPACEAERKYIEDELSLRKRMGEAVCVTGVAIGILATPYTAYAQNPSSSMPVGNEVAVSDTLHKNELFTIKGRVKDADGAPVAGAIIAIGYKRPVVATDVDGNFSVAIPRDSTLRVQYIGYEDKVYPFSDLDLNGLNTLCLTEEDTHLLGEMVVAGIIPKNKKSRKHKKEEVVEKRETENKVPDTLPSFIGGTDAMKTFIAQNLCMPESLQGAYQQRIFVSFCVLGDGSLADVKVVTDCPQDMREEILRLVNTMPEWKPAMKDGKPTYAKTVIPIDVREVSVIEPF